MLLLIQPEKEYKGEELYISPGKRRIQRERQEYSTVIEPIDSDLSPLFPRSPLSPRSLLPPSFNRSGQHHELGSVQSPHIEIDRRFLDPCRGESMSLPGPNVRINLDSRHLAWPHLLRDPDPPATATDRASGWPRRQWGFQGQGDRSNQQLKFACCQCRQQSWSFVVGSHEFTSPLPSTGCLAGSNSQSHRLCMCLFLFNFHFFLFLFLLHLALSLYPDALSYSCCFASCLGKRTTTNGPQNLTLRCILSHILVLTCETARGANANVDPEQLRPGRERHPKRRC